MSKGTLIKSFVKGSGGGGDIGTGAYNVKVIDYDGTIIAEKNLDEGKTFKLPKAPSHDGLVFQEWSATQEIVNGKITVGKNDVMIGAVYTTASGKNEFDIELTTVTGLSVTLNIDGDKDWGDGTIDSLTSHTYSQVGKYTIKCDGTTMTTSSLSGLFGQSSSARNYYVKSARIATIQTISAYAFAYCVSLRSAILSTTVKYIINNSFNSAASLINIILNSNIISFENSSFNNCQQMQHIILSSNFTTVGGYSLNGCLSLKELIFPNSVTSFGATVAYNAYSFQKLSLGSVTNITGSSFQNCYGLTKVKIPKTVTTIGATSFGGAVGILEYDFSEAESVPTLSNVSAFNSINALCKIKVPSALYDEWIAEANWVTYEDYIVAV